jgi:hypothetical protein
MLSSWDSFRDDLVFNITNLYLFITDRYKKENIH